MKAQFLSWYNYRRDVLLEQGVLRTAGTGGYILIVVLLVMALLAGVSSDFIISQQMHIRFLRKFDVRFRAGMMARSGAEMARILLAADRRGVSATSLTGKAPSGKSDSYHDLWAVQLPSIPLEDGVVDISIDDEQKKINISILANDFVNPTPYYGMVQRLMVSLNRPMDLADVMIDWVDRDSTVSSYGAESSYYLSLPVPYEAGNGPFYSIEDLNLLKGITPAVYYGWTNDEKDDQGEQVENNDNRPALKGELMELLTGSKPEDTSSRDIIIAPETSRRLSRYLRVYGKYDDYLHQLNRININTASYRVLSALTENMTDAKVTEIIRRRSERPFNDVDELKDLVEDESVRDNILTVNSSLFDINITARLHGTQVKVRAVYNRSTGKYLIYNME